MGETTHALVQATEHLHPRVVFHLGAVPVTSTVVDTWVIMALMFIGALLLKRKLDDTPTGVQALLESVLDFFYGIVDEIMGREGRRYLPLIGTNFMFIVLLNFAWFIPGMPPPTSDLSTTAALALTTMVVIHVMAIRKKGMRAYLHHFVQPSAFMLPLNILEEMIRPFSLALRLFGNLFGGEMVALILAALVPVVLPVPIMFLEVLMGVIQAFIFAFLTATYIGAQLVEE